mmetsp:Transcript_8092/g.18252  ORF Transcript_8092/g.18252 Transcript_8092/m.18252 type:complete len:639 (-) Transcript_8092:29-1945(-)|eukprot:CAMPEP_0172301132 /NCGR_PEP_ID=MMETSP1058-20130122/3079_1 /TAXON_ID=83371 /ORGANISM="Detonula confervacea, Strain CCMP 353" /LENGTH=638 /DNA_ID=CAMNT_0013011147 /DNA_START=74 /DNA_END=1990 /DNA_ORIENTATION=-
MNKSHHTNKLNDGLSKSKSYDEDSESCNVDVASMMGQARSSVRGAMSDADSTVGGGLVTPRTRRMMVGEGENLENSTAIDDDDGAMGGGKSRSILRGFRWWSDVVSRVSRSASSLLNQHSPNLNDILDGTGDVPLELPRRGVHDSIPEDPCGPITMSIDEGNEQEVFALREEVALLKKKVLELEEERGKEKSSGEMPEQANHDVQHASTTDINDIPSITPIQMLRPDQISRYSRQLLLNDGFGVTGQKKLLSSSILVIGAGGIGSTVLLYLAAAGVGHITIVDYDCVEMSNLHRQVIHKDVDASKRSDEVGMNKALSAKQAMLSLNPTASCTALAVMICADNALELVSKHDVVVDACDNPQTRYLLNDACILAGKPLVSGSAMGTEGQLTVYNYQPPKASDQQTKRTACYRCLYPKPVAAEGCKSCSDNGVLGMVPGAIGILQAVETIKVVTGIGNTMHDRLMMYDSLHCSFLNIKKPPARPKCAVCSTDATIKTMKDSETSLENVRGPSVCAMPIPGNLSAEQNISAEQYDEVRKQDQPHVLLDVRVVQQFEMCALEGSVNLPLEQLESQLEMVGELSKGELPVYCLCRRGIASAEATRIIQKSIEDGNAIGVHSVFNIAGGLNSWVNTVDSEFPQY